MLEHSFILPAFLESGIALGPEDKDIISVLGAVTCYQGLVLHIQLTVIMYQALQQNPVETVLESEEEQIVQ